MATSTIAADFEIVTNKAAKSAVWKDFGFVNRDGLCDKKKVACKICRFVLKYSGNTSNLFDHMKRKHGSDTKSGDVCGTKTKQAKLEETCSKTVKLSSGSQRAKDITVAVMDFIIKDLRPFCVVQNAGFRNLIHVLEPRYTIPSRQYFSQTALPALYDKVKIDVIQDLKTASHVSLTTDGWTSRATESYITVTSSHIDDNWEIKNYVLQTRMMPEAHTGVNIAEVLTQAITEWQLKSPGSLVTDNAANMGVAAKEAGFPIHIGCFAHTLNLACGKALKISSISKLLAKMRKHIGYFHRSTTAAAVLKQKQEMLNLPSHKLISDCPTRWNSTVDMIERYLEQHPAIISALTSKDLRGKASEVSLNDNDLTNAEELLTVLKPLKTATVALCEEKVPTLSIVLPLQFHLINNILKQNEDDPVMVKQAKTAVSADLDARYRDEKVKCHLTKATLLDPRFKSAPFLSEEEKLTCYQNMTLEAVTLFNEEPVKVKTERPDDEPPLPNVPETDATQVTPQPVSVDVDSTDADSDETDPLPKAKIPKVEPGPSSADGVGACAMTSLFGDVFIVKTEQPKPLIERAEDDIKRYRQLDPIPLSHNPLIWWREHVVEFGILSRLAKKYLSIPATSVPSERVFSTAGDILSAQRSTLKSHHVDKLLFLKKNLK